jgi:DNA polymerase-3 subunit delta
MVTSAILFLAGRETVLKDEQINQLRKSLFKDPSALELNYHSFDASRDTLSDILNPSQTAPFLASKRMIVVHRIDALKETDKKHFLDCLAKSPEYAQWVLTTDEKHTKTVFLKSISKLAKTISCETPYKEGDLRIWIAKKFKEKNKIAGRPVVDLLIERVGKQMSLLNNAIEQICVYAKDNAEVTAKQAENLFGVSAEQNVFELYDALKDGDMRKAMLTLRSLKADGRDSYEIIGSLVWQFDRMLKIKNLLNQGEAPQDVARKMGVHQFFAAQVLSRARRLKSESLKRDLGALLSCDASIKKGLVPEDLALERCVLSLNQV